jgi:hypothetical protein
LNQKLWFQWILATTIGWGLIGAIIEIGTFLGVNNIYWVLLISGVSVGFAQWRCLKQRIKRAHRWVWISGIGYATGLGVLSGFGPFIGNLIPWYGLTRSVAYLITYLLTALASALVGGIQWLFLRREIKHAAWWIPATIVSLTTAAIITSVDASISSNGLLFASVFGFLNGVGTGAVLASLPVKRQEIQSTA